MVEHLAPGTTSGPLHRFRAELGERWPQIRPLCLELDADDLQAQILAHRARMRRASTGMAVAADVTGDLEALLVGWQHYGPAERAVLRGAVRYVTDPHHAPTHHAATRTTPTHGAATQGAATQGAATQGAATPDRPVTGETADGGPDLVVGAAVRALLRR